MSQKSSPDWKPSLLILGIYGAATALLFRDFIFSGQMLYGSDTLSAGYMLRAFYADALGNGDFPGWNPMLFGGTPFLASLAGGDSLYPPSLLLLLIIEPFRSLGWKLVLHVFLAGAGMYGWSREIGVGRKAAAVAGLGYLVAPFMVTLAYPGHDGKLFVTALTPFLFWAVHAWGTRGSPRSWAGIAVVVALVTLTTHFQMAYFLFGTAGAFAMLLLVQGIRKPDVGRRVASRRFALFLGASLVGAGAAGVQLFPAVDYILDSSRRTATTTEADDQTNKAYAASWSMHVEEAVAAVVLPEFVGSSVSGSPWTDRTYWGRNAFKLNHEYIGWLLVLLGACAFVGGVRSPMVWFMGGLGATSLLYTLGAATPVWHLFYEVIPGMKLFRAASMAIFIAGFAVTTLAAIGLASILGAVERGDASRQLRVLLGGLGLTGAILLLTTTGALEAIVLSTREVPLDPRLQDGLARLRPFLERGAMVLLLLSGGLVAAVYAGSRKLIGSLGVAVAVGVLIFVDGARIDAPFLQTVDFDQVLGIQDPNVGALSELTATEDPFRVLDLGGAQPGERVTAALAGVELTTGHHPNDLARYRELLGMPGGGLPTNIFQNQNALLASNTRYVIWPTQRFGSLSADREDVPALGGGTPVSASQFADGQIYETVYELPGYLDRARLVSSAVVVDDSESLRTLLSPSFDVRSSAVLTDPLPEPLPGGIPNGDVQWEVYQGDRQELSVTTDRPSLLVVSDNWTEGWTATVDGAVTPIYRANHTFRAVPVPAGTSEVVLTFQPSNVRFGMWTTVLGSLLILGAFLMGQRRVSGRSDSPGATEDG